MPWNFPALNWKLLPWNQGLLWLVPNITCLILLCTLPNSFQMWWIILFFIPFLSSGAKHSLVRLFQALLNHVGLPIIFQDNCRIYISTIIQGNNNRLLFWINLPSYFAPLRRRRFLGVGASSVHGYRRFLAAHHSPDDTLGLVFRRDSRPMVLKWWSTGRPLYLVTNWKWLYRILNLLRIQCEQFNQSKWMAIHVIPDSVVRGLKRGENHWSSPCGRALFWFLKPT